MSRRKCPPRLLARNLLFLAAMIVAMPPVIAADIFSYGRCQNLAPAERELMRAWDVANTESAARKADREIGRRLAAGLNDPARRDPSTQALVATIEGWLLKKAWLAARARHEHDADEGVDYCEFLRRRVGLE